MSLIGALFAAWGPVLAAVLGLAAHADPDRSVQLAEMGWTTQLAVAGSDYAPHEDAVDQSGYGRGEQSRDGFWTVSGEPAEDDWRHPAVPEEGWEMETEDPTAAAVRSVWDEPAPSADTYEEEGDWPSDQAREEEDLRDAYQKESALLAPRAPAQEVTGRLYNAAGQFRGTVKRVLGAKSTLVVYDEKDQPLYVAMPDEKDPSLFYRYQVTGPDVMRDLAYEGQIEEVTESVQGENQRWLQHYNQSGSEDSAMLFEPVSE